MQIVTTTGRDGKILVLINDQEYVPKYDDSASIFRMTEKDMRALLEVQSTETIIKLAKACHGALYHKARK